MVLNLYYKRQNHYHAIDGGKYPRNKVVEINGVNYIFIQELVFKKNNLFTKFLKMTSFSFSLFVFFLFNKISFENVKVIYSSSPDLFTLLLQNGFSKRKNHSIFFFEIRDIWPLSQKILHNFSESNFLIKILSYIEMYLYRNSDLLISPLKNFDKYLSEKKINTEFKFIPQSYFNYNYQNEIEINIDLKLFLRLVFMQVLLEAFTK